MCGVLLSGDEMLNSTGQCFDSAVVSVWMLGLISYTGPPPSLAAVCSSALITLQIVLLMFFLCLFTMGGGRDGCGLVERCTAVGVNCYLLSTDSEPILTSSQSCMELNQAKTSDSTGALSLKFQ